MEATTDTLIDITDEAVAHGVSLHVQVTPRVRDDVLSWDEATTERKGMRGGYVPQREDRMCALLHSVRIACGPDLTGPRHAMERETTVQHYRIPAQGAGRNAELVILRIEPVHDGGRHGVVVSLLGEDTAA